MKKTLINRKSKSLPAISTASLPDIVFMLLFFFMVTTVIKKTDLLVELEKPNASEVIKLENREQISHLYIGKPVASERLGPVPRVQVNDVFVDKAELAKMARILDQPNHPERIVSLEVDMDVQMGLVTEVKQILREGNALKISYAAFPTEE